MSESLLTHKDNDLIYRLVFDRVRECKRQEADCLHKAMLADYDVALFMRSARYWGTCFDDAQATFDKLCALRFYGPTDREEP